MKRFLPFLLVLSLAACASPNRLATDETGGHYRSAEGYGRSAEAPILVGGLSGDMDPSSGPASERAYLDRLRGPNGEPVTYERAGSCCQFPSENSPFGAGLLDVYEVEYDGLGTPVSLYFNMYDRAPETLRAPEGFTLAQ